MKEDKTMNVNEIIRQKIAKLPKKIVVKLKKEDPRVKQLNIKTTPEIHIYMKKLSMELGLPLRDLLGIILESYVENDQK